MLEVICIDHEEHHPHLAIEHDPTLPEPEIGEIMQVLETKMYKGVLFYRLAGYGYHGYDSANYAPLNGMDERDRLEAWQSERLTQEDRMLMALAEHMPEEQLDPVAEARIWKNIKATL